MTKEIAISKSVIRESGPGDLIIAINCNFWKGMERKIYPIESEIPLININDLCSCDEGFDCFQIHGSEESICVCKIKNEKIRAASIGWKTIEELY